MSKCVSNDHFTFHIIMKDVFLKDQDMCLFDQTFVVMNLSIKQQLTHWHKARDTFKIGKGKGLKGEVSFLQVAVDPSIFVIKILGVEGQTPCAENITDTLGMFVLCTLLNQKYYNRVIFCQILEIR